MEIYLLTVIKIIFTLAWIQYIGFMLTIQIMWVAGYEWGRQWPFVSVWVWGGIGIGGYEIGSLPLSQGISTYALILRFPLHLTYTTHNHLHK